MWDVKGYAVAKLLVPGWECVFGLNDSTMRDLVFWIWILRSEHGVAIIDTGLPAGEDLHALNQANQTLDERCVFSPVRTLEEILARENLSAAEVDYVLLTQLVTYCTGGFDAGVLRKAAFFCAWDGMVEFLTEDPGHPLKAFYFTADGWVGLRTLLIEKRICFAKETVRVAPGLEFEPTGGHHPGSVGVKVQTRSGQLGILETAFVHENIEWERPIGIAENAARCREVIRKFKHECRLVVAGHDPDADARIRAFLADGPAERDQSNNGGL